jgi:hypothetical protein
MWLGLRSHHQPSDGFEASQACLDELVCEVIQQALKRRAELRDGKRTMTASPSRSFWPPSNRSTQAQVITRPFAILRLSG